MKKKSVGIIAEYNPFHNGHLYQLNESVRLTGAEVIIAAMSGNFVQRGGPAIADKWDRAEAAVRCGVDIAVEMQFGPELCRRRRRDTGKPRSRLYFIWKRIGKYRRIGGDFPGNGTKFMGNRRVYKI